MRKLWQIAVTALLSICGIAWAGAFENGVAAMERGDYVIAASIFQPLATEGNKQAQYNLGMMFEKGRGVPQDYLGAMRLYQMAAAQGSAEAQRNLGVMYRDGLGAQRDLVRAYMWLNLGASESAANAADYRNAIARVMKPEEIVQAQKLANDCRQRSFKGCDSQGAGSGVPASAPPGLAPAGATPSGMQ